MIPIHEEINIAVAKFCGWTISGRTAYSPNGGSYALIASAIKQFPYPNYCEDRNSLEEVLRVVYSRCEDLNFNKFFGLATDGFFSMYLRASAFRILKTDMRLLVEVALRSCGEWPIEWDTWESYEHEEVKWGVLDKLTGKMVY